MKEELIEFIFKEATRQGVSYNKLSKQTGISRYQVQNLAYGRSENPSIKTVKSLLAVLGYTLEPQLIVK
jgi:transcriptional regulator with XRE-family HTH domain